MNKKKQYIYAEIDETLKKKFNIICIEKGIKIQEAIVELIEGYVRKNNTKN